MSLRRSAPQQGTLAVRNGIIGLADGVSHPFAEQETLLSDATAGVRLSNHNNVLHWEGQKYQSEWDFKGIPEKTYKELQLSDKGYAWMPTPVGFAFAANLQLVLTHAIHKESSKDLQTKVANECKVLMGMAGFGGDTIAMASFFKHVTAGDFCEEQVKRLKHNVGMIKKSVVIDSTPQNVLHRKDIDNFSALILEPCWREDFKASQKGEDLFISEAERGSDADFEHKTKNSKPLHECVTDLMKTHSNLKVIGMLVPGYFNEVEFHRYMRDNDLHYLRFLPYTLGIKALDIQHIREIGDGALNRANPWTYTEWKGMKQYDSYNGPDTFVFITRYSETNKKLPNEFLGFLGSGMSETMSQVWLGALTTRQKNYNNRTGNGHKNPDKKNNKRGAAGRRFWGSTQRQNHQADYKAKEKEYNALKSRYHQLRNMPERATQRAEIGYMMEKIREYISDNYGNGKELFGEDFEPMADFDFDQEAIDEWEDERGGSDYYT